MDRKFKFAWILSAAPLLLAGASAWADGVPVTITNDNPDDLMVTVYDTTAGRHAMVLSQRVNGFTNVVVNMTLDPTGRANMAWTAVTVDPNNRLCGHAERTGLADSSTVHVHAHSECGAT